MIEYIKKQWNSYLPKPHAIERVKRKLYGKTYEIEVTAQTAKLEDALDNDQLSALTQIHTAMKIIHSPVACKSLRHGEVHGMPKEDYEENTKRLLKRYDAFKNICLLQGKMPVGFKIVTDLHDKSMDTIGIEQMITVPTFYHMLKGALDIYLEIKEKQEKEKPIKLALTDKMLECKEYIRYYTSINDIAPSYREIAEGIDIKSHGRVAQLVDSLVKRGHALRMEGTRRSVIII